ncbi:LysR substrate-binding domain-containing protein, partial [Stenotrophomonas sp. SrG]|uniref:LysR substrate-binding domain-containing protein n=1 Tax=Stenotrophomonas sp. SrG TaxID=3414430 RepID=UPI003CF07EAF
YPEIQLDMHLGKEMLDLIAGEADLALRGGALPDSNRVARKLGSLRTQVFASPAYIERFGEPLHPDELQFHRILAMRKARYLNNNRFFW